MVDMSGSTKGWINDMEREALVLLCDRSSSSATATRSTASRASPKRCELLRIKRFRRGVWEDVQARISGMRPMDYTRMGVAIRHLTQTLNEVEARTRLLITLSDGRPDDRTATAAPTASRTPGRP